MIWHKSFFQKEIKEDRFRCDLHLENFMENRVKPALNEYAYDLYKNFYECLTDTSELPFIITKLDCFTILTTLALDCQDLIFERIVSA